MTMGWLEEGYRAGGWGSYHLGGDEFGSGIDFLCTFLGQGQNPKISKDSKIF